MAAQARRPGTGRPPPPGRTSPAITDRSRPTLAAALGPDAQEATAAWPLTGQGPLGERPADRRGLLVRLPGGMYYGFWG